MTNNCVIAGNLTVQGVTTNIDTQNVLVKDNVMVLNSASDVGKDAGLMFKRNAADSTAFWWDESALTFVLATTDSLGTDATLAVKELQKLKCAGIEASSALVAPGFATSTVSLAMLVSSLQSYIHNIGELCRALTLLAVVQHLEGSPSIK